MKSRITYKKSGVNYSLIDPLKILAQRAAHKTLKSFHNTYMKVREDSRGESAYVAEYNDCYLASVIECLGTKNLIADNLRKFTGKTYYDSLAVDTVAMIVNDLTSVGALPQIIHAYWSVGSSDWFKDKKRLEDLTNGWAKACSKVGAVWGGGETPTLSGIVNKETINLAGSGFGIIKPKKNLVLGKDLKAGDAIVFLESSGVHANGISLTRKIVSQLKDGYKTKLASGKLYGETLLTPTILYTSCIRELLKNNIHLHYLANITGHGFKKLMRAKKPFTYIIKSLPKKKEIFSFIQEKSNLSDKEMYETFNMGAGFVIYVAKKDADKVVKIAKKCGIYGWLAGIVERGKKQVIIEPKNIVFEEKSLGVRL